MNTYSTSIVLYFYLFKYVDIESKYQLYILFNVCLLTSLFYIKQNVQLVFLSDVRYDEEYKLKL